MTSNSFKLDQCGILLSGCLLETTGSISGRSRVWLQYLGYAGHVSKAFKTKQIKLLIVLRWLFGKGFPSVVIHMDFNVHVTSASSAAL